MNGEPKTTEECRDIQDNLKRKSEAEQVIITNPNGVVLSDEESREFLEKLQAGVFYLPQRR